jgi:hypothetical protein
VPGTPKPGAYTLPHATFDRAAVEAIEVTHRPVEGVTDAIACVWLWESAFDPLIDDISGSGSFCCRLCSSLSRLDHHHNYYSFRCFFFFIFCMLGCARGGVSHDVIKADSRSMGNNDP